VNSQQDLDDTSELHEMYDVRVKKSIKDKAPQRQRQEAVFSL
jgi:hypothetical protein